MDTSYKYRFMCEKATEIQEIILTDRETVLKNLPAYFYDKKLKNVGIGFWTPSSLRKAIRTDDEYIWVNINQDDDMNYDSYVIEDMSDWRKIMIWLPRQDQLQKIWGTGEPGSLTFPQTLASFITTITSHSCSGTSTKSYYMDFESFEQLWLAIIMSTKYGKTWDNEKKEWV